MPKVNPQIIGIVGSRRRDSAKDYNLLIGKFDELYRRGDCIVSGGCEDGADFFAEVIAKARGITILIHYPRKEDIDLKLIKSNPTAAYARINYARNTLIAADCDVLIALPAKDRKGGTEDTINKALSMGKKVILI